MILLSPQGARLDQEKVAELAREEHLVLVCGRYEGVDQRVIDLAVDEEISIGDYVLSGGEVPAMAVIEAVTRLVPGVLIALLRHGILQRWGPAPPRLGSRPGVRCLRELGHVGG